MRLPLLAVALAAIGAVAGLTVARADGEAGLVVQNGADVQTFCVAFEGDSISGADLLKAAGLSYGQFGSGNTRVLCSIDRVGCMAASDFDSCFCQCKSGGASCTYWAFFTQRYRQSWVYSPIAFTLARAHDGDMQAWKWGQGSQQSAPVPVAMSFEQVCGHPAQGGPNGASATPEPTEPPQPATPTVASASSTVTVTVAAATAASSPEPTATGSPEPSATGSPPGATATTNAATAQPSVTTGIRTVTPADILPPATGDPEDDEGDPGINVTALAGFGAVLLVLVTAIGLALARRRRHDA